ncbi:MAG: hypothetical protein V1816_26470 [Pseudomonadota bacterium]
MDLIDLMKEKAFLGQEFLTWVWFQSEVNSSLLEIKGYGPTEIWFQDRLTLESGWGDAKQKVTCQGKVLDLAEAKTALKEGKKVSQAKIRVSSEGREWKLTVKAEGFDWSAVKAPKTLDPDEEESDELAGRLLDRVAVLSELTKLLDTLYAQYLAIRLTPEWEGVELPRIRRWLKDD